MLSYSKMYRTVKLNVATNFVAFFKKIVLQVFWDLKEEPEHRKEYFSFAKLFPGLFEPLFFDIVYI